MNRWRANCCSGKYRIFIRSKPHTKTEMVYQYRTGPRFRQRVGAIVEAFSNM